MGGMNSCCQWLVNLEYLLTSLGRLGMDGMGHGWNMVIVRDICYFPTQKINIVIKFLFIEA
jgi:hypothetical protein